MIRDRDFHAHIWDSLDSLHSISGIQGIQLLLIFAKKKVKELVTQVGSDSLPRNGGRKKKNGRKTQKRRR